MVNNIIHNLLSVSELQRAPGKALKRLRNAKSPLYITQRGRPVAILSLPEQGPTPVNSTGTTAPAAAARREELLSALQTMLPAIIDKYSPEKILLFGSLATGTVHENSDIDLLIIKKTPKRFLDRQLDVIHIASPVVATDFFVYTPEELAHGIKTKPHFFQDEVLAKGQVLYEKTN
jgi:predicted nucleotidyltransferase